MSKQLYDEIQSFLLEKWGPLGGWCQAVMFAADLPPTTVKKPRSTLKQEHSPDSPVSTALGTPADEKPSWIDVIPAGSPLKGREKRKSPTGTSYPGIPAVYGFKRTRSAARIELQRTTSSVSAVAEAVKDLEVE